MPGQRDSDEELLRKIAEAPNAPLPDDWRSPLAKAAATTVASPPPMSSAETIADLPLVAPEAFTILGEHARGGMGRVLLAHDRRLGRAVAIKELLRRSGASDARFVREAVLTARLQHPSIVPVHEAGRWASGEPFYVMKLVQGRPLNELIRERRSFRERAELLPSLIAVVEAIAYAHSKHIIHRDLKPDNVIVGDFGETVVIDWGLAKEVPSALTTTVDAQSAPPEMTANGAVVGTPSFMAPEQAKGESIDERADVYALGAILYMTLCGEPPYAPDALPSVLNKVLSEPPPPLASRAHGTPTDLVAIVEKAMARDRNARYPSAAELAADLKRFETGQLVAAYRYSPAERARRWLRRHRLPVTVSAAALLALALVSGVSVRRIMRERSEAIAQRALAQEANARAAERFNQLALSSARSSLPVDPTSSLAWLKTLPPGAPQWAKARAVASAAEVRGVSWRVLRGHSAPIAALAFTADGNRLATAGQDRTVRLWDLESAQATVLTGAKVEVQYVAFAAEGVLVAAGADGVLLWNLAVERARLLPLTGLEAFAVSTDGRTLAVVDGTHRLRLWHLPDGAAGPTVTLRGAVLHLAFSPDGRTLATRDSSGVQLWRDGVAQLLAGAASFAGEGEVAFSPDGKRLAAGGRQGARIWVIDGGRSAPVGEARNVLQLRFSSDGKHLALASDDGVVLLLDVATGHLVLHWRRGDAVHDLALSPDGTRLAVVRTAVVREWDLVPSVRLRKLWGHELEVTRLAFSPDSARLATGSIDGSVRVWSLSRGSLRTAQLPGPRQKWAAIALSPDGERVAMAPADEAAPEKLVLWYVGRSELQRLDAPVAVRKATFSRDGARVATIDADGRVRVRDLATGDTQVLDDGAAPDAVGLSSDGAWAVTSGPSGLRLWRPSTGERRTIDEHGRFAALAFSTDAAVIAGSPADSREIYVWEVGSGQLRRKTRVENPVEQLAFVDAQELAIGSRDGMVRVRDLVTDEVWLVGLHGPKVVALAASDSGVGAVSDDGVLRFWANSTPAEERALRDWLQRTTNVTVEPSATERSEPLHTLTH
jgi:WD40 repeat protein